MSSGIFISVIVAGCFHAGALADWQTCYASRRLLRPAPRVSSDFQNSAPHLRELMALVRLQFSNAPSLSRRKITDARGSGFTSFRPSVQFTRRRRRRRWRTRQPVPEVRVAQQDEWQQVIESVTAAPAAPSGSRAPRLAVQHTRNLS